MGIIFGFKKKSNVEEVVEKYNYPVLTSCVVPAIKGSVARFEMNKALLDVLGIDLSGDNLISIGQNEDGQLVLANTTGMETPYQFHVNKDGSFNSKKLHERLTKTFSDFNPAVAGEFNLTSGADEELNAVIINGLLADFDSVVDNELPAPPEFVYIPEEDYEDVGRDAYFAQEELMVQMQQGPTEAEYSEINRIF